MRKTLLIALSTLVFMPSLLYAACGGAHTESPAGTWTTYDASYDCVDDCVQNSATVGETVVVKDGDAEWASSLVVNKSLVLRGGTGTITTNLSSGYAIDFSPASPDGAMFEMSGFTIDRSDGMIFRAANSSTSVTMTIYIHGNTFDLNRSSQHVDFKTEGGVVYGCISKNTFTAFGGNLFDLVADGDDTWGNFFAEAGSANNLFIEDNIFASTTYGPVFSGQGMKGWVFRYNTVTQDGSQFTDMHGSYETWGCGTMQSEIYGNKIIQTGSGPYILDQRGGQSYVFYNALTDENSVFGPRVNDDSDLDCSDCSAPSNPQSCLVSNSYYFNQINSGGDGTMSAVTDATEGNRVENTHFWVRRTGVFDGSGDTDKGGGIGCGTLAERNAVNMAGKSAGIAWWVTDQSCTDVSTMVGEQSTRSTEIEGYLSVWDGDSWGGPYDYDTDAYSESPYIPYTYPHPLRQENYGPSQQGITDSGISHGGS